MKEIEGLYKVLGYSFHDKELLERALSHRSFSRKSYERLEFLGDAVLSFIMAEELFKRYPRAKEGELSRRRAFLVNADSLFVLANKLGLSSYLRLGSGELKSGGQERHSILADAMEAIIGAVFLDGGIEICHQCVIQWYGDDFEKLFEDKPMKDSKSRLQEWLQAQHYSLPIYSLIDIQGKAHAQMFTVRCSVNELGHVAEGKSASRRKAEQEAAEKFLKIVQS
ncbi:MAG: ribonuclease III [Gammaproteobacteria bacterium RIFOXYB2_FULL_38_6]|nr:MAG: ribonuclease III [Gammaproteobacteria bacterium RIFOXYB2_FULL_38_6]